MKKTGAKIIKSVTSILLAATILLSMTGCGRRAEKAIPAQYLVQLE